MISIIIPTLNEESVIGETLKRIKSKLTLPHEVIVSDGRSSDRTVEIARNLADKVLIFPGGHRQTIGEGRNDGAKEAKGEYLVFLDADVTIPEPDAFFKILLNKFEADPNLSGVMAPVRPIPKKATVADKLGTGWFNLFYRLSNNVFGSGNAGGEFQMMRADTFKNIGGFRTDLPAGEDNDMFRRLRKIGRTEFASEVEVYQTCRRAHKVGWLKLILVSAWNGMKVMFMGKSAVKEWKPIR